MNLIQTDRVRPTDRDLGPVHTYPDTFKSATFLSGLKNFPVHTLSDSLQIYYFPHSRADSKTYGFTERKLYQETKVKISRYVWMVPYFIPEYI